MQQQERRVGRRSIRLLLGTRHHPEFSLHCHPIFLPSPWSPRGLDPHPQGGEQLGSALPFLLALFSCFLSKVSCFAKCVRCQDLEAPPFVQICAAL